MGALVTGCAGFVCSHLTEQSMGDGFDVIGINRFRNSPKIIYQPQFISVGDI
ncbi:MAG: NAD-dependent epimerase/dehydratase family protein [Euryarchaeota archaeon]|nr:NAD-dependent epimerase/dehydratase family protein [Euryarchaeota archaeon]